MTNTESKERESPALSVDDALKMYEDYKNHWSENYREAAIDLKMAAGDRGAHWGEGWDDNYVKPAKGTPAVVVNELPQYIHQVTNDIRQNTPSIKVIPEADGDEETAEVFAGAIRGIEYKSSADEAYDTAADYAVKCSIGYIKVGHGFCDDESDLQEMQISSVPDPLSVFNDPATVEWDGRDANGQIDLELITKKRFEKLYSGKEFVSFTDAKNKDAKDTIILANIYLREYSGPHGKTALIRHYKFSGSELIAETTFPGSFCPYTPVYGEMFWIDGKRVLSSLIRQAREPQRRLNHWASKESQILSMAPIAPIMAVEGTIVNERRQYQIPGLENVLEYRQLDLEGNPAPAPQRLMPPMVPAGFINAMQGAKENIKESMGIYSAGLGKREGDASGRALESLQHEGDVATFHFPDNVRRSINQVGRILIEAIPDVYDTPRIIQIVNEETDVEMVGINGGPKQEGQERDFDLTKGKYHVRVTTGASYTTKRKAEADLLGEVIKGNPELMQVFGDIWAKNLDGPGSQAMAARLKKMIPAQLQDDSKDPQVMALMQQMQQMQAVIQQGAQQIQQLEGELQSKQGDEHIKAAELQVKQAELDVKQQELAVKQQELQVKQADLAFKAQQLQQPQAPVDNGDNGLATLHEHDIKEREMQLKEAEFQLKVAQAKQQSPDMALTPDEEQEQAIMQQQMLEAEAQEKEIKAAQTKAMLDGIEAIVHQLQNLTASINTPKRVMRDPETGAIVGVQ